VGVFKKQYADGHLTMTMTIDAQTVLMSARPAGWPQLLAVEPAPDGEACCRLRGDALRGIVAFRREALTLQVLDRYQNRRRAPRAAARPRPARQAWQAGPHRVTATCCQHSHARLARLCVACMLWRAPLSVRTSCGILTVEPCWAPQTLPLTALAAGRVASSDRVAAELSGPGGAVITASVAERGRGVYTLFFTVDRAGAWALLPSVRPGL